MTMKPTKTKNLDIYGAPTIEWSSVQERLDQGFAQGPGNNGPDRTVWLATTNDDGSPHVVPLGGVYDDGRFYFVSGPGTRKSQNVARDAHCALTVATTEWDLTCEGRAERVTKEAELQRIAKLYEGWGPEARDGAFYHEFSAPSAGPPPWYVYEVTLDTVFAFGTAEPYGATRFDF